MILSRLKSRWLAVGRSPQIIHLDCMGALRAVITVQSRLVPRPDTVAPYPSHGLGPTKWEHRVIHVLRVNGSG